MNRASLFWIFIVVIAVSAVGLLLFHTRNGPGITGDSVHYVMGAENMLLGNGYSRTTGGGGFAPITGFPPGYSVALAGMQLFGLQSFESGRILNSILFGINVVLVGGLIFKYTRSIWFGLLGAGIFLLSEDMIQIHSWVMSEGLFIFLILVSIWVLALYLDEQMRTVLVLLGLLIAGATLTRFVGFAIFGTATIMILFFQRSSWWRRFVDLLFLAVISLTPVALWFYHNSTLTGTTTNRVLSYHPISMDLLFVALGTINAWVFPIDLGASRYLRGAVSALVFMSIPALFIYTEFRGGLKSRKERRKQFWSLPWILLLLVPAYLAILFVNSTFLDASTSLAGATRYLSPVFVLLVVYILCVISDLLERASSWSWVRVLVAILSVFLLTMYAFRALAFVSNPGPVFRYTSIKQDNPELVQFLHDLDPSIELISNDIELTYVLADRPAHAMPIAFDHYIQRKREDFEFQVELTRQRMQDGALLVILGEPDPDQVLVIDRLEITPLESIGIGTIYSINTR